MATLTLRHLAVPAVVPILLLIGGAGPHPGRAAARPPARAAPPATVPATSPAGSVEREAEPMLEEVAKLLDAGRDDEAGKLLRDVTRRLEQAAAAEPRSARLHHLLGRAHLYGGPGQSAAALAAFRKAAQLDPKDGKSRLMAGTVLMEAGKEAEALELFKQAVAAEPAYAMAHYNVGQLYQNGGKYEESLAAFRAAAKLLPDDYRVRAKVIQNLQALGRPKERDQERDSLLKLHKDGKVPAPMYCREQFTVGKEKVMAFEYFELKGERAVRYAFNVLDETGADVKCRISLGSYPMTNAIARQTGTIGKDGRIFHLDGYYADGEHRTFGMFTKEPTYEETRKMVAEVIEGKMKPQSGFNPRGDGGADIEVPLR
jgi:tetratricopeptide (TPR) repeat protein